MPTITIKQDNLTAYGTTANLLAGSIFEFLSDEYDIDIYFLSSASGVNLTFSIDNETAIDDQPVTKIGTTINRNDHLLTSLTATAGSRMVIKARETAGVATSDILMEIDYN